MFALKPIPSVFLDITSSSFLDFIPLRLLSGLFSYLKFMKTLILKGEKFQAILYKCLLHSFELFPHWKKWTFLLLWVYPFSLLCLNYSYVKWCLNSYIFFWNLDIAQREPKDTWEECTSSSYFFFFWSLDILMLHWALKEKM